MSITSRPFGNLDGQAVDLYHLENSNGVIVEITNYGGIVVSIHVPDRSGILDDIALGFNNLDDYRTSSPYFGALVGRYGNRIAGGRFSLNGTEYILAQNDDRNSLHGGVTGLDKVLWSAVERDTDDGSSLVLTHLSPDGDEGFPGNLSISTVYTLTESNELRIDYDVSTDADTVQNLTHHSYFNLAGEGNGTILDHTIMINADRITPVDDTLIPTGELMDVSDTPFDLRHSRAIGDGVDSDHPQMILGGGYDHNFVLNEDVGEFTFAAEVIDPTSGRVLRCYTTEPGVQFYVGNFLDGTLTGKRGSTYPKRSGFCLEPQHFPDSPNQPNFPTTVLRAGERYQSTIIYQFSVID
jgi:aldose 1-epimerase